MRFLISELAYEKPLATGRYAYSQAGLPNRAVESWRLTDAIDGYRFLRIDLDARDAPSGRSYLYHCVLNPAGRVERLTFRVWAPQWKVKGNVLLEETSATVVHEWDYDRQESHFELAPGYAFWFPSAAALRLVAEQPDGEQAGIYLDAASQMQPQEVTAVLTTGRPAYVPITRRETPLLPRTLQWADQRRTMWLGDDHWPLYIERQDDLTAHTTRHFWYAPSKTERNDR